MRNSSPQPCESGEEHQLAKNWKPSYNIAASQLAPAVTSDEPDQIDVFFFAGLWSSWKDPEEETYNSYSIITTSPNKLMEKIHDRMPVILTREEGKLWLDPDQNPKDLLKLLKAYPADSMEAYEVSKEVNKPGNNHPGILDPVLE